MSEVKIRCVGGPLNGRAVFVDEERTSFEAAENFPPDYFHPDREGRVGITRYTVERISAGCDIDGTCRSVRIAIADSETLFGAIQKLAEDYRPEPILVADHDESLTDAELLELKCGGMIAENAAREIKRLRRYMGSGIDALSTTVAGLARRGCSVRFEGCRIAGLGVGEVVVWLTRHNSASNRSTVCSAIPFELMAVAKFDLLSAELSSLYAKLFRPETEGDDRS